PVGRKVPGTGIVIIVSLLVGIAATIYTVIIDYHMAYGDAMSHLTIARRIFDSQSPGFQQLGTVWLPFPHLALLPFVSNLWLWETGIAGSILGTLCLVASATAIYRITARINLRRVGRIIALIVFL